MGQIAAYFLCFIVIFGNFFVIFGKFVGFYHYFIAFFAIMSVYLGIFSGIQDGVFAIFLLFLGHFWVDTMYVGWTSGCQQLNGSNCSIFFVFHCHFWQFFVIFGKFVGFYHYFIAFFAILSVYLGIFSGIQDGVSPVAPFGE